MKITEVPLGFPVNKTIETDFEHYSDALTCLKGIKYNYKLIIHLSEEQRKKITEQTAVDSFKARNFQAENVKVVFDVQRSQHIRSPEIIHARTNAEKLAEYLKVNEIQADEDIYAVLKDIEDNLDIRYVSQKHSFTLLKVRVRGSIGLHEKSGMDEYELDFRQYPRGIIALTGAVGHGKSTLIENCQPYLKMLTRSGKLQDHFYLRDSCRELLYIDEEGTYYKIDIQIDGKNKSGKVKAFVQTGKDLENLQPVPDCDGNTDPYEKWVNDTFGPIELYLRTAFYTKGKTGNIPDIAYATKGEKKNLFSTLIGIEGLADIAMDARERAKIVDKDIDQLKARVVDLEGYGTVSELEERIRLINKEILSLDERAANLRNEMETLKKNVVEDVSGKIKELEKEKDCLEAERVELEQSIAFVDTYNKNAESYDKLEKLYAEMNALNEEYFEHKVNSVDPLYNEYNTLIAKIGSKEKDIGILKAKIESREADLADDINDTCPTCGQKLPADKIKELTEILDLRKSDLSEMKKNLETKQVELHNMETQRGEHEYHAAAKKLLMLSNKKSRLLDEIAAMNITIDEDELREVRLRYKSIKSPEKLHERLNETIERMDSITGQILELSKTDSDDGRLKLEELKADILDCEETKKDLLISIGRCKEQKNSLIEAKKQNEVLGHQIDEKNRLAARYSVLEQAFGANGIQALELEALSPEIAEMTNGILESIFGGEYKVSFKTLRVGSSGKLIEDFEILVETVSTGTIRPLEWVSGGEGTIIKEALYNAFSMARQKSCGVSFRTKFADEMDSAIDPDFRPKYLQMVRAVHEMSGTEHTIMITHSSEVKDAVESRIEL